MPNIHLSSKAGEEVNSSPGVENEWNHKSPLILYLTLSGQKNHQGTLLDLFLWILIHGKSCLFGAYVVIILVALN
jgi:hypothetical protein